MISDFVKNIHICTVFYLEFICTIAPHFFALTLFLLIKLS